MNQRRIFRFTTPGPGLHLPSYFAMPELSTVLQTPLAVHNLINAPPLRVDLCLFFQTKRPRNKISRHPHKLIPNIPKKAQCRISVIVINIIIGITLDPVVNYD